MRLQGRIALVTGASRGLGKATAIKLAEEGADVICVARDKASCAETVAAIEGHGRRALALSCDVGVRAQIDALFEQADAFGPLDILFNNAGFNLRGAILDVSEQDWDDVQNVCAKGVFLCAQQAARRMKARGKGVIVNNGSIQGEAASPGRFAYCAAKAAVHMMTKVMACEWAEYGLRVNCVAPGFIETERQNDAIKAGSLDLDGVHRRTPMGRRGQDTDIADAVVYLCSDESRYVTGTILNVDGGYLAYGFL